MAITPYLYYEDVSRALTFLAKAFGFRRFGRPMRRRGTVAHAAMKVGEHVIMMGRPPSGYRNPRRLGQATQSLLIDVSNVDAHFARAVKAGATVLQEPMTLPFGARRYGVTDPEGHEWYFTQPVPRRK